MTAEIKHVEVFEVLSDMNPDIRQNGQPGDEDRFRSIITLPATLTSDMSDAGRQGRRFITVNTASQAEKP